MDIFHLLISNFLSAPLLFFLLGIGAGLLKSDIHFPESLGKFLAIYLMIAIGLKGGLSVQQIQTFHWSTVIIFGSGIIIGFIQPFLGYWILKRTTSLDRSTAAAVAAHYGSVSLVTFITAVSFLKNQSICYEGFMIALMALMEAPAIISGLIIAKSDHQSFSKRIVWHHLSKEILSNGAIILLLGSFFIGWIIGPEGFEKIAGLFMHPFQGILCLFLLEMGLSVSREFQAIHHFPKGLLPFGIFMPICGAIVGIVLSTIIGLNEGTSTLFTILLASASYIAVPAAMRLALPEVKPVIYIPLTLGITFPFNVLIGIPVYYAVIHFLRFKGY